MRVGQLQEQLIASLEQLPHVQAAGLTNFLPATGATLRYQVYVDGLTGPNADGSMTVGTRMISGGYLRAIRASLVAGEWCPALKMDFNAQRRRDGDRQSAFRRGPRAEPESRRTIALDSPPDGNALQNRRRRRQHRRRRSRRRAPVPYVYTCNSAGRMAGSRVRREDDGPARLRRGLAPAGPRAGSEPCRLRSCGRCRRSSTPRSISRGWTPRCSASSPAPPSRSPRSVSTACSC